MEPIDSFTGKHAFLSNFMRFRIEVDGITFPSSEHAYQAMKTLDHQERIKIAMLDSPGKAKRAGRKIILREDWEEVKLGVMEEILRIKFSHPRMKELLNATAPRELIEGNQWNDTFWGVCDGKGENHLGRLLMKIREAE